MTKPTAPWRLSILTVAIWLAVMAAFLAVSAKLARDSAGAEVEATARGLTRMIAQRVAQHDAHLTALVALVQAASPPPEAAIRQVGASILRFYPRITQIDLVDLHAAPGDGDARLLAMPREAAPPDLTLLRSPVLAQPPGEARAYVAAPGGYVLAKRAVPDPAALAILMRIDASRLVDAEEWPGWAEARLTIGERVIFAHRMTTAPLATEWLPRLKTEIAIDSASQPLRLVLERPQKLTELVGGGTLLAMLGLSVIGVFGVQLAAQRAAARAAERRARLSEHEARLAHASRVNAMGELASGLAHELTQPLTALLAQSQAGLRLAAAAPPDLALIAATMASNVREAKRADAILKRIRDYVSNTKPTRTRSGVNGIVKDVADLVAADLRVRNITLVLALAEDDPVVIVDRIELEQVLHNLVRNAADAVADAAPERRRIEVRTASEGRETVITVTDDGPGIPPDVLARLFEPFFTTKAEGMGLGLSLCESLIGRMEGRIAAANRPEGGARFTIGLPAAPRPAATLPEAAE